MACTAQGGGSGTCGTAAQRCQVETPLLFTSTHSLGRVGEKMDVGFTRLAFSQKMRLKVGAEREWFPWSTVWAGQAEGAVSARGLGMRRSGRSRGERRRGLLGEVGCCLGLGGSSL